MTYDSLCKSSIFVNRYAHVNMSTTCHDHLVHSNGPLVFELYLIVRFATFFSILHWYHGYLHRQKGQTLARNQNLTSTRLVCTFVWIMLFSEGTVLECLLSQCGDRPLHYAAVSNALEMVEFLVSKGCCIDAPNKVSMTVEMWIPNKLFFNLLLRCDKDPKTTQLVSRFAACSLLKNIGMGHFSFLGRHFRGIPSSN